MSSERLSRWSLPAADVAAALLLLVFGVMKAYALAPALSDENIYFYMCSRIAEGALPYRDFFFAHPPFHLIPGALLMSIVGFSLPLAKVISPLAAAMAGGAVYRAARRCGPLAAILALVLYLFSYDLLRASSHYTGANEATALLAWALERALASRPRAAGLLAASAALVAFYAIPAGVALLVWMALRGEPAPHHAEPAEEKPRGGVGPKRFRAAFDYALACAALFTGVNLICLALFRADYWDPVFRYHLMKPPGSEGNLVPVLRGLARENPWLLWSGPAAAAALLFAWRREGRRGRGVDRTTGETGSPELRRRAGRSGGASGRGRESSALLSDPAWASAFAGLLTATLHMGFFSLLTRVYPFYALPAFPALAIAGGIAYAGALRAVVRRPLAPWLSRFSVVGSGHTPAAAHREAGRSKSRAVAEGAMIAAILIVPLFLPPLFPYREIVAEEGEIMRRYTWHDAPLPAWVNGLVRALLWSDERVAGDRTLALTRSLWAESRRFTAPEALAEAVRRLTPADGTVFGDSIAAPLVALLSGRSIARDHVDTNSLRYRSGITPPAEAIAELEAAPPAAIIAHSRWGLFVVPEMRDWIRSRYEIAESVGDPIHGRYDLYLPKPAGPADE